MKKIVQISMALVAVFLMSFSVKTLVSWKADTIDAGVIPQGTPKTFEFVLTNESDKDLVITNVKPTCGCTASDYTKEAIPAGKTGFVKATYNASIKGAFNKTITVYTSLEETPKLLTLKGEVN